MTSRISEAVGRAFGSPAGFSSPPQQYRRRGDQCLVAEVLEHLIDRRCLLGLLVVGLECLLGQAAHHQHLDRLARLQHRRQPMLAVQQPAGVREADRLCVEHPLAVADVAGHGRDMRLDDVAVASVGREVIFGALRRDCLHRHGIDAGIVQRLLGFLHQAQLNLIARTGMFGVLQSGVAHQPRERTPLRGLRAMSCQT